MRPTKFGISVNGLIKINFVDKYIHVVSLIWDGKRETRILWSR